MSKAKSYVPEGLRTVTPHLAVPNALDAIEFYKQAFGAELVFHSPGPTPRSTAHAQIRIGDSAVFVAHDVPNGALKAPAQLGGSSAGITLYVPDCDKLFNQAVAAGARINMPLEDMFWGDRYGQVRDPAGHVWAISTHKEDLSPEEIAKRAQAFMAEIAKASAKKQ